MATKDEWVEPEEFDKIADEVRAEKGGDLKKVNANMIATRMGRKKANVTFYRLFDDWKQRRRVQSHLPPFVVQDKHREMLENVLIAIGTEVSAEATHVAGFRTRDLQDENDCLRSDRNDLLTVVDERDAALESAGQQIEQLNKELTEARAEAANQAGKVETLAGRLFALQDVRSPFGDPAGVRHLAELIASAVAKSAAKQSDAAPAALSSTATISAPDSIANEQIDLLGCCPVPDATAATDNRDGIDHS